MTSPLPLVCALALAICAGYSAAAEVEPPSGAELAGALHDLSLDATHTFRVRDLQLVRGDIKIYLNEGILSFLTPVDGRVVAALFTTEGAEAGDAEVILLPPQRSERASLASFTKSPNLDEHFSSALFLFTDNTASEVLGQLDRGPVRETSEAAGELGGRANSIARSIVAKIDLPLVRALLDRHPPERGFFYGVIAGRSLGAFNVSYDPSQAESVTVGRVPEASDKFQLWTNFRPRHAPPFSPPNSRVVSYRIEVTVHPDLSLDASANLRVQTDPDDGRVLALNLSPRLKISSAAIDGKPVEVFERSSPTGTFLLVSDSPFSPGQHQVSMHYTGNIIRRTANGEYFVDERNTWYPSVDPLLADFDLTFHCPERLRLVSTGEKIDESVADGVRTVHRQTVAPAALAGFNLGEYNVRIEQHDPYSIEIDSPSSALATIAADPTLPAQTSQLLEEYTKHWIPLPIRSVVVSPIAGYFGQGFPGLIYLSSVAYIKETSRSAALRNPRFDAFFSELLLAHEIAHQWWGNVVRQSDYRSAWLTEAMANDSALEHIARAKGSGNRDEILESFRQDLIAEKDGKSIESAGPVDFGERLIDTHGFGAWQIILYEKGSWILQMLRSRLGEANYRKLQIRILQEYGKKPIGNEGLRELASAFVPAGQPDKALSTFFETWIYGTGIPALSLHRSGRTFDLEMSGVDDDFLCDVPLRCGQRVHWVRASSGSNPVDLPNGVSSCELPSLHDFLYIPLKK